MTAVAADCRYHLQSASRSHVGRVRQINEDRVFDDADAGVWAVADGMGGHSGGDLAAQQIIDCLRQAVAGSQPITPRSVTEALHAADDLIRIRNRRLRLDAGATVVAATFDDGTVEIAWAGDSRAYRVRDGKWAQLTHDHSVVQQMVDAGLLTPAMAECHPQAHIVTRALGVHDTVCLDTVRCAMAEGDRLLLCSDGLSRSLDVRNTCHDLPLTALADHLVAAAIERDGTDNVSLVLIEIGSG